MFSKFIFSKNAFSFRLNNGVLIHLSHLFRAGNSITILDQLKELFMEEYSDACRLQVFDCLGKNITNKFTDKELLDPEELISILIKIKDFSD